jgi:hypothetical protein
MPYTMKPLSCDPARIKGMSERLIVSHYENNYGGAVKRLSLIEDQLAQLEFDNAAGFLINGLKREQLVAMNSMILHELFFDGLGDQAGRGGPCTKPLSEILDRLNAGALSLSQWEKRSAVVRDGCCYLDRRAIASWSTNGTPTIATYWLVARRSWCSICTSTPITWISAPKLAITLIALWM